MQPQFGSSKLLTFDFLIFSIMKIFEIKPIEETVKLYIGKELEF